MKKNLLKKWLNEGPEELNDQEMFRLFKDSLDEISDVRSLFAKEKSEMLLGGLIIQKNDMYSVTPEGVAFAWSSKKLTKEEVFVVEDKLKDKILAWNFVAQKNNLPGIACALVFGSLAEKRHMNEFGDIDCAIMWRRTNVPTPLEKPSQPSLCGAHAVLASLKPGHTAWDVEDAVEVWLTASYVSLGSIDQLALLSEMGGVKAWYPILEDALFDLTPQKGVRQDEQDVLNSISTSKRSPERQSVSVAPGFMR